MKSLLAGCESAERFELLIKLTKIKSEGKMTNHKLNIVKLADLIAEREAEGKYLTNKYFLVELNALVHAHALVTGTKPIYYTQDKPEEAKDYDD